MHIPWEDLQLFLAIAEGGSISAAAKRLRTTQPTVSRRLSALESLVGERLFTRTAAGVSATAHAERLLLPARRMAEWAAEADRAAERVAAPIAGVVRLTAPPGVAVEFCAPFAAWLKKKLPAIRLEVVASLHYLDLVRREADLALRIAPATQKELVTLAVQRHGVGAFGSKDYVASLPKKPHAADIAWIGWASPLEQLSPNPELARLIPGWTPVFASDDFLVQLAAAEAGLGAVFLGRAKHRFSTSKLVEIDVDVGTITRSIHLVCARSALDVPRIRAVADLLTRELERAR